MKKNRKMRIKWIFALPILLLPTFSGLDLAVVAKPCRIVPTFVMFDTGKKEANKKRSNRKKSNPSFYGTGSKNSGSKPATTEQPIVKNPVFRQGTIFIESAGSYIASRGAVLIINDKESYPLKFDSSGAFFTVSRNKRSSPGGLTLTKLMKNGKTVNLKVKNPGGKSSVGMEFTRQ